MSALHGGQGMQDQNATQDPSDRKRRALVTGGTGFVGGAIAERLHKAGFAVRLATRAPANGAARNRYETTIVGDLRDPVDWGSALDGVDVVVHAAGLAHQPRGVDDALIRRINVDATERLAQAASRAGVARFLLISSVRAIAGSWSPRMVTDDAPPEPTETYGRSKLEAEQAALASGHGVSILRPAAVCGAGVRGYFALMARVAATPLPLPLSGLEGRRSFITDRNLADAALFTLEHEAAIGRSFLVAEPTPLTVAEFVMVLRAARGAAPNIFRLPSLFQAMAMRTPRLRAPMERLTRDLVVDSAALRALGWSPAEPGDEGIRRMAPAA